MEQPTRLLTGRFVLIVVAGLAYFMALGVVLPVVPQYVKHQLGGNSVSVGVAVGALFVGAVLLRPYAGRLGDRFGRRILIVSGALVVALSVLAYGAVEELWFLIAVRALTGLGEAAFFVGAASMVADLAPVARRGEAFSYWSVAVYGGLAFGPALGEAVLDSGGTDTVWILSCGLGLLAAALGACTREVPRP
jgi:MFS family permease